MIRNLLGFCKKLLEFLTIRLHCLAACQNIPKIYYFRKISCRQLYDGKMDFNRGQSLRMAGIKTVLTDFTRQ
ncbi:hypothetical protein B9Z07_23945 [Burkholderia cenocepacia]|uniref:Uncharacterized protein n=1 Tax=Burkholderia cenocepacia TaxID=95486 RepID=A0AAD0NBB7_9BURK|nr:hypothetical protein B9Z07_23945 [Burkholderia cenocepacia]PRE38683.1 hypothetical protein C6P63_01590 [Burkholderia cenocepacia]